MLILPACFHVCSACIHKFQLFTGVIKEITLQIMLSIILNAILKRHVQNFTPSSLYGFQLQSS